MWGRPTLTASPAREALDHAPGALAAAVADPCESRGERGVGGIEEVGEQVKGDAVGGAGDLRAAQQAHPGARDGVGGLVPSRDGVVVGQTDDVKSRARSGDHEGGGGVGSVRAGGVGVGVDSHARQCRAAGGSRRSGGRRRREDAGPGREDVGGWGA